MPVSSDTSQDPTPTTKCWYIKCRGWEGFEWFVVDDTRPHAHQRLVYRAWDSGIRFDHIISSVRYTPGDGHHPGVYNIPPQLAGGSKLKK